MNPRPADDLIAFPLLIESPKTFWKPDDYLTLFSLPLFYLETPTIRW
jgi:hypothetical protein